jgi:hypothetical protein
MRRASHSVIEPENRKYNNAHFASRAAAREALHAAIKEHLGEPCLSELVYFNQHRQQEEPPPTGSYPEPNDSKGGDTTRSWRSDSNTLLMTLLVLRTGLPISNAAVIVGVDPTSASRWFTTWILFLAEFFKKEFPTPSLEQINQNVPKKFNKLMEKLGLEPDKLRHIIDATELFSDDPSCPRARRTFWSEYKHHCTVKILGDIGPNGNWNSISEGHGGRITDVELIEACGWLEILESNIYILADRGFIIQRLLDSIERLDNVTVIHPEKRFKGQTNFTASSAQDTSLIARAQIHVERSFARVKQFRHLQSNVDLKATDIIGKVFYVICMLTHYMLPITVDWRQGKNRGRSSHGKSKSKSKHKRRRRSRSSSNSNKKKHKKRKIAEADADKSK